MSRPAREPVPANYSNRFTLYFFATRPAFILATLAACLLGLASTKYSGVSIQPSSAVFTIVLGALVHAAVNVLNDYFDEQNGTDVSNTERLYPYTGGSRFIQNGVLTPAQTLYFAYMLLAVAMLGGLWLSLQVGSGLLFVGAAGIFTGWAYSASPLRLNSRGLGELCVLLGFLGIVIGADFVQRLSFSFAPFAVGMPYALLATNLLYINQFPDRKADAAASKRNLVVRLQPSYAVWLYLLLATSAFIWVVVMAWLGYLPWLAWVSVLPLLLSLRAFLMLMQFAEKPEKLLPAIKLTLATMLSHALLLALIMLWKTP